MHLSVHEILLAIFLDAMVLFVAWYSLAFSAGNPFVITISIMLLVLAFIWSWKLVESIANTISHKFEKHTDDR